MKIRATNTNPSDTGSGDQGFWSSHDLGLCAALLSSGFELASLDNTNRRKVMFVFEKMPQLEIAINDFWANRLMVNARGYFENIKSLKSRIYSDSVWAP